MIDSSSTPPSISPTQPAQQDVMSRVMSGAWITQGLHAAARLRLADLLSGCPRSASEIARACHALPDRLERLLRALAGEGVFFQRPDGRYENTPLSETLRTDVAGSLNAAVQMNGAEHYLGWSRFLDCLREEKTAFEIFYGEPIFAWYEHHPEESSNFNAAMAAYSSGQIPAILAAYDPTPFRTIVDVGGGHGALLRALLERSPGARGIVFDLEQGLAAARTCGLDRDPRIELVAGDFFQSVVAGGDLYVLKYILHDWDDERCVTILRHIRAGLVDGGKVLVAELLVGPPNEPDLAKWFDLHMMAMPGGRERTRDEFAALFARADLRLVRVIPTAAGLFLLEASAVS